MRALSSHTRTLPAIYMRNVSLSEPPPLSFSTENMALSSVGQRHPTLSQIDLERIATYMNWFLFSHELCTWPVPVRRGVRHLSQGDLLDHGISHVLYALSIRIHHGKSGSHQPEPMQWYVPRGRGLPDPGSGAPIPTINLPVKAEDGLGQDGEEE